ncbi:MAG: hypothetical protein WAV74_16930 [Anaerolineae bacterium]
MNRLLQRYLVAVESSEVSGFEHLDMLMLRDKLAEQNQQLTARERTLLVAADRRLFEQASMFDAALSQITSLAYERSQRNPPPSHWWWYLDVVAGVPKTVQRAARRISPAASLELAR